MAKSSKKPGPKPREWTEQERGLVRGMAIGGVPHDRIAKYLNTTGETLRKHFRNELDHGMDEIKALATKSLIHNLRANHPAMTMFFFKTQCGWKETEVIEVEQKVDYVDRPKPLTMDEWTAHYRKNSEN